MATKEDNPGSAETFEDVDSQDDFVELDTVNKNDKTDTNPSSGKTPGPRLAVITGMLMEKNKPNSDNFDQDYTFDNDSLKGMNSLRFGKSGLTTTSGKRPGAFSTRSAADKNGSSSTSVVTDADIRKFVFLHSRSKRLVNGLKVHSLNKQTFLSSFSVGIVLGIFVALVCKLLSEFIFSRAAIFSRSL